MRNRILADIARNGTTDMFDDARAAMHAALHLPDCAPVTL
ncbi:hypothetical protein Gain_0027_162 [Komagataeibacter intermedius TF2]|uniref:FAD-dependent oxidoreductase n=2 Tax=Komagataeibacter intermedius TaxID=66229 RepID=A0A0N1FCX8_9PROT|nr:FAD-dependent oxidoreductase [Komagataeibacter intermedius AF2]GAN86487.1 hypothetical protein Gain_0027_162 [Komagataeibacter intermedius TF2]GBQ68440.1 hypothetical protein AA0521_1246 [Komagataeibacter intermedius NRIC 0521]